MPASLIEKTQRDRLAYGRHWRVPNTLRVFSYDLLGRVQAADALEEYQPDLIICDEVHRLKNRRAAVTRRVARYMYDRPYTIFCGLSGSVMDRSLKEFAHILRWALKLKAPVPTTNEELEEWAEALDHGLDPMARRKPGALLSLCSKEERSQYAEHVAARHGFRRRLTETPGVVATVGEGESVGCSIYVRAIRHKVAAVTEENFAKLRGDGADNPGWLLPDGTPLVSAVDVWRHAQELALGLHYEWNPRPPDEWLEARKNWHRFVRETISRSRTFDSALHVANAVDSGELQTDTLERWRQIEPTFTPNVVPVWHDDSALKACAEWMKTPGLVWTEHHFFAERLSEMTGAPYYGAGGFAADGQYIEAAAPGSSAIASIDANREGKNLQGIWSRCAYVCPPSSATWIEQSIARLHRPGQMADEVQVDVFLGCRENFDAICKAIEAAQAVQDMTGKKQKILMADLDLPTESEIDLIRSPRWTR